MTMRIGTADGMTRVRDQDMKASTRHAMHVVRY